MLKAIFLRTLILFLWNIARTLKKQRCHDLELLRQAQITTQIHLKDIKSKTNKYSIASIN